MPASAGEAGGAEQRRDCDQVRRPREQETVVAYDGTSAAAAQVAAKMM